MFLLIAKSISSMKIQMAPFFYALFIFIIILYSCNKERADPPVLTTAPVSFISATSASGGGDISDDGGSPVTSCGVCWSNSPAPTLSDSHSSDSSGTGTFASTLTGLTDDLVYYVRAYATNNAGTSYGQEVVFDNSWGDRGTFRDTRGEVTDYEWVRIGGQIWMAENLAYLPLVSLSSEGSGAAPSYYVYGYEGNSVFSARATDNFARYGVLYNHPAALESCPDGWHLPSDEEWKVLKGTVDSQYGVGDPEWEKTSYQGYDAGTKLKAASGWREGVIPGTDLYGFTGLPGGYRQYDGGFFLIGDYGYWWASTMSGYQGWCHYLLWGTAEAGRHYFPPGYGYSVRCIRD
jgi:uncharacterized protein (TIGR02145 family)